MSNKDKGWKSSPFVFGSGIPFDDTEDEDRKETERFIANKEQIGDGCYRTLFDPDELTDY